MQKPQSAIGEKKLDDYVKKINSISGGTVNDILNSATNLSKVPANLISEMNELIRIYVEFVSENVYEQGNLFRIPKRQ